MPLLYPRGVYHGGLYLFVTVLLSAGHVSVLLTFMTSNDMGAIGKAYLFFSPPLENTLLYA